MPSIEHLSSPPNSKLLKAGTSTAIVTFQTPVSSAAPAQPLSLFDQEARTSTEINSPSDISLTHSVRSESSMILAIEPDSPGKRKRGEDPKQGENCLALVLAPEPEP